MRSWRLTLAITFLAVSIIGMRATFSHPSLVYAGDFEARTNEKVEMVIGNDGIDRHLLSLKAGTPISVSVYFGNSRGLGLGDNGRLRLLRMDGTVLLAPATERSEFSVFVGFWLDAYHYFSRIQRYEVPWMAPTLWKLREGGIGRTG